MSTNSTQQITNSGRNSHITYGTFPKMPENLTVSNETLEWFSLSSFFNTNYKSIQHSNNTIIDKPSIFSKFL